MIFLAIIGAFSLAIGFSFLAGEILVLAFERKIKRVVKKCKKEWSEDEGKLKRIYCSEVNYIDTVIDKILEKSSLVQKEGWQ